MESGHVKEQGRHSERGARNRSHCTAHLPSPTACPPPLCPCSFQYGALPLTPVRECRPPQLYSEAGPKILEDLHKGPFDARNLRCSLLLLHLPVSFFIRLFHLLGIIHGWDSWLCFVIVYLSSKLLFLLCGTRASRHLRPGNLGYVVSKLVQAFANKWST